MAGKQKVFDEAMAMAANFSWDQNWTDAVKSYRAALEEFPDDANALAGLGTAYYELAQYASAVRVLQRALKADPTNQDIMTKIGEALEKLGRFDDAAKTYSYSGNVYAKAGQLEAAITEWQKAVRVNPEFLQARNNLAQAYAKTGKKEDAISELIGLAGFHQGKGDNDRARQYLQGAQRLDPQSDYAVAAMRALENGASIRSVKAEMEQSVVADIATTTEAISGQDDDPFALDFDDTEPQKVLNPREKGSDVAMEALANVIFESEGAFEGKLSVKKSEIDAYIGQVIDLQTRGSLDKAIGVFEQILDAGFRHPAAQFQVASLYLGQNQHDKAISYFNQAKADTTYFSGANFGIAESYRAQGNANQALEHLVETVKHADLQSSAQERANNLNQLYTALVNEYVSKGNNERTMAFVDALVTLVSSKNWESKIANARQQLNVKDRSDLDIWVEFLQAGDPDIVLTTLTDTSEYLRQNMMITAAEACYWAIQHAPNYLPLHIRLAEIYLKQDRMENGINKYLAVAEVYEIRGNMKQVMSIYQKVLDIAPMDVTVRSKLIDFSKAQGDFDGAMRHYNTLANAYYQLAQVDKSLEVHQEALKIAPQTQSPKASQVTVLHNMADIYTQRVDWRNAARVYEQIIQISPNDDRALLQLVDLYFKLNQRDQAVASLDKLLATYEQQQNPNQAIQVLQELISVRNEEYHLHHKLASFYAKTGRKQQALDQYNTLGEMQLEAGLPDDAAQTIETIIALGPDDPAPYEKLLAQIRGGI